MILCSGCSFTSKHYNFDGKKWPMWPEILFEGRSEYVNCAKQGNSNRLIVNGVFEYLAKNDKPTHIFLLLSGFERFFYRSNDSILKFDKHYKRDLIKDNKAYVAWAQHYLFTGQWYDILIETNFLPLLSLILYCEQNNIKYLMFPTIGSESFLFWKSRDFQERFVYNVYNNVYYSFLQNYEDKLLGFPWFTQIGGKCLEDYVVYDFIENDGHPSELGQKQIAQFIYNEIIRNACLDDIYINNPHIQTNNDDLIKKYNDRRFIYE